MPPGSQSPAGPLSWAGVTALLCPSKGCIFIPLDFGFWTPGGASWPNGTRHRTLHALRAPAWCRTAPHEPRARAPTCLQREGDVHPPVRPHHRAAPRLQRRHDGSLGWLLLDAVTDVLCQRAGTGTGPMSAPASTSAQSCRDGGGTQRIQHGRGLVLTPNRGNRGTALAKVAQNEHGEYTWVFPALFQTTCSPHGASCAQSTPTGTAQLRSALSPGRTAAASLHSRRRGA